jgi:hypothetical protein
MRARPTNVIPGAPGNTLLTQDQVMSRNGLARNEMSVPIVPPSPGASVVASTSVLVKAPPAHHMNFRELLSELNPLQYIPVIGTIYRAITGDTIPESARMAGSLVVSGLAEGPVGVATNVAMLAVEKITGIDPEKIGTLVLARLGIGHTSATTQIAARHAAPPAVVAAPLAAAWSPAQLAAYGVTTSQGVIRRGNEEGSDVLNSLELTRIETVT